MRFLQSYTNSAKRQKPLSHGWFMFSALDALINEYNSYNTDSALAICRRRELLARKNGNPVMIRNAMMNTANVLATTGMYKEAMEIMDTMLLLHGSGILSVCGCRLPVRRFLKG